IGGATTSPAHTAVKNDPSRKNGATVHVADASRAVGVVSSLLSDDERPLFVETTQAKYQRMRDSRAGGPPKKRHPIKTARTLAHTLAAPTPPAPTFTGTKVFEDFDLSVLAKYIDWTPYFASWDLAGRYPQILNDEIVGEAARDLWRDTEVMMQQILGQNWFKPKAVIGFWPAARKGDDIQVLPGSPSILRQAQDEGAQRAQDKGARQAEDGDVRQPHPELVERHHEPVDGQAWPETALHTLRQQMVKDNGKANFALSDFVAETGDHVGGFAVTAGPEAEQIAQDFEANGDDYSAIMVKALADRFAEAMAEYMHERVRKELWGYAREEALDNEALIKEAYMGIRPAPGYPCQPDHTEKQTLFKLLDAGRIGMELTTSCAMTPAASVSGLYLAHPESAYFAVGRIERDQVEDYAKRKGMELRVAERWLGPILNYEPGELEVA
ncbi:MAG: vitamin B12 dependent-methionine synthase activation domain-containing protein, partial [Pseudomonadota bacterium]